MIGCAELKRFSLVSKNVGVMRRLPNRTRRSADLRADWGLSCRSTGLLSRRNAGSNPAQGINTRFR